MNSLYEISDRYNNALSAIESGEVSVDDMADTLDGLQYEITEKAKNVAMWRENQLIIAKSKKELAKKLNDQAAAIEKKAESMIDYLFVNMKKSGVDEIECGYFDIKFKKNRASVNITDEGKIPKIFIKEKTTESIDKVAIKKAIDDGEIVDGAELVRKEVLTIK